MKSTIPITKENCRLTVLLVPLQFVMKTSYAQFWLHSPGIFCDKYTCLLLCLDPRFEKAATGCAHVGNNLSGLVLVVVVDARVPTVELLVNTQLSRIARQIV